jgi:hypothetical protein
MKTTYKVVALTPYMGHQPGETFEADLDPDQARRALERGSIKAVKKAAKPKQKEEADG